MQKGKQGRKGGQGGQGGQHQISNLAVKVGIAGAVGFGAVVTGFLLSRRGRRIVREAWHGRRRTALESRVLDVLLEDSVLGRRDIDVHEIETGVIQLTGTVRRGEEADRAAGLVEHVEGVADIDNALLVEAG